MIDLRVAHLLDFVPESIASDPEVIAISHALDIEIQAVASAIVDAIIWPRIGVGDPTVPEDVLDAVARDMNLAELGMWAIASVADKRSVLQTVFLTRKRSGTLYSVKRIFGLLHLTATVIEWFQEGAPPYTYRVMIDATGAGVDKAHLVAVPPLLFRFAPARCHLRQLAVEVDSTGQPYLYSALTVGRLTTIPFGGP